MRNFLTLLACYTVGFMFPPATNALMEINKSLWVLPAGALAAGATYIAWLSSAKPGTTIRNSYWLLAFLLGFIMSSHVAWG